MKGEPPDGGPSYAYRVIAYPVDFELYEDWNEDSEPNDDAAGAQDLSVIHHETLPFARMAGSLEPDDVDVYRFETSSTTERAMLSLLPPGPDGNGSTGAPRSVRLRRDDAGNSVLAEKYVGTSSAYIRALLEPGQAYLAELERSPGAPAGSNDFYLLKLTTSADGVNETEPNDVSALSNDTYAVISDPNVALSRPQATLPPGDVDWWDLSVGAGASISLWCGSLYYGSGLRYATYTLYDPGAEQVVWEGTKNANGGVSWQGVAEQAGEHFLRVTATDYAPGIESTYYGCSVTITNPSG